jgi:hypothetical protein
LRLSTALVSGYPSGASSSLLKREEVKWSDEQIGLLEMRTAA